jgi:hypothetical protein
MEVVRDTADNCHHCLLHRERRSRWAFTPATRSPWPRRLTLTDKEYQVMRNASIAVLREIGVETGGSNVQFAINPKNGRIGGHRNEPTRLAILRSRLQGHRFSHRQDRGQAGGGLHTG